jgi:hypothetical protein
MHGQGTYTWANGDKYVGAWKDDNMHGQGTKTFNATGINSGMKHVGAWKDGVFTFQDQHGRSIFQNQTPEQKF